MSAERIKPLHLKKTFTLTKTVNHPIPILFKMFNAVKPAESHCLNSCHHNDESEATGLSPSADV